MCVLCVCAVCACVCVCVCVCVHEFVWPQLFNFIGSSRYVGCALTKQAGVKYHSQLHVLPYCVYICKCIDGSN